MLLNVELCQNDNMEIIFKDQEIQVKQNSKPSHRGKGTMQSLVNQK